MNPDVKIKWLEALRSGKYQQGRLRLKRGHSYCCLGVLCDLRGNQWDVNDRYPSGNYKESSLLPPEVAEWAGFPMNIDSPAISYKLVAGDKRLLPGYKESESISLSILNDSGFTFQEIANLIERYL
jgi:hypothetical protein